jgi:hypothetical protein
MNYPYITDSINQLFNEERKRLDFILLRPILLVLYFFLRTILFPLQFLFHRRPFGYEARLIDRLMCFGIKYFGREDAVELIIRHVQIEPLLYRHILSRKEAEPPPEEITSKKLNGIDGDYNMESLEMAARNNMTIGHDLLSYEIVDRFDRKVFLDNIDYIRSLRPADHSELSKAIMDENRAHSLNLLGPTNLVLMIVIIITVVGDLHTTITALNSFGSDSILLWCTKHLYEGNSAVQCDLDFFMQEVANRGHYNNSAFFSNPSQYLYYHIVFDEVVYDLLRNHPPAQVKG